MVKITLLFPERFTETWKIRTKIISLLQLHILIKSFRNDDSSSNDNYTSMICLHLFDLMTVQSFQIRGS